MGLAGWVIGVLNWPIGLGWNGTDLGLGRTRLDNGSQVTHLLLLHKFLEAVSYDMILVPSRNQYIRGI